MRISGIYKITNINNNKFYVGSAYYIKGRWGKHRSQLRRNIHKNKYLQNAWNKNGETSFVFEILEECAKDVVIEREQYYIDLLKPEYNISMFASNTTGVKTSDEVKEKLRNLFK